MGLLVPMVVGAIGGQLAKKALSQQTGFRAPSPRGTPSAHRRKLVDG